jgi:hypothetical protein
VGWLVVPQELVRPIERLAQNFFISVPTLSQHAALAAFECRDELDGHVRRYRRNRDLLLAGLPEAGFDRFAPAEGAFYLYCDVAHLTNDSRDFCRRMLAETGVATTPGIDFDRARGAGTLRISFAGSTAEMEEAVRRLKATAYAALVGKLGGPAKVHLEADQARFLGDRGACDASPPSKAECLEARYRGRAEMLAAIAKGPYPFISQQVIVRSANGPNGRHAVDIAYPRFDGQSADFASTNRRFAAAAETEASDAMTNGNTEITQTFALYRPAPSVVSVTLWREWAGATINIDLAGYLVDLPTGRILEPQEVFMPGDSWRHRLAELVGEELAKDSDRKSEASDIAAIMREVAPKDYLFEDDKLILSLGAVARERAMKGYVVAIPYSALKGTLRAGGPLGSLQR